MQCAACRAVYSNGLEFCPRCKRPASSASSPAPTSEKSVAADKKAAPRKASRTASAAPAAQASEVAASRAVGGSEANAVAAPPAPPAAAASTLIEFPGTARNRPQWRKDLSERVREIQARRAREAALESESATTVRAERATHPNGEATTHATSAEAQSAPQLGLVPPAETPEMNPIVAAALRRIERARQTPPPPPVTRSSGRGAAATAVARVVEEQYEAQAESVIESESSLRADSQAHASGLVVISAAQSVKVEATSGATSVQDDTQKSSASVAHAESAAPQATAATTSADTSAQTGKALFTNEPAPSDAPEQKRASSSPERETKPLPRRIPNPIIDDSTLTRLEAEILPPVVSARDAFDDRAPLASRFVAAFLDLLVVAFLASPCAAVIELTSGNWSDPRVAATMGAIFILVMFLYQTGATALAGRTLGMKMLSLHTVDAESALSPTTGQSVRRALIYMLSLVTFGLGLIYALFDAEGRAAHDHLSGTVVVRE
ncbi:MAG TPA: RDD family protein [Pyrinomonadaceae bacterium]|nr:RDD family protein [Pyrinomonadaceae bacterium]